MTGETLVLLDPRRPIQDFIPYIEKAVRPGTTVVFVTPLGGNHFTGVDAHQSAMTCSEQQTILLSESR